MSDYKLLPDMSLDAVNEMSSKCHRNVIVTAVARSAVIYWSHIGVQTDRFSGVLYKLNRKHVHWPKNLQNFQQKINKIWLKPFKTNLKRWAWFIKSRVRATAATNVSANARVYPLTPFSCTQFYTSARTAGAKQPQGERVLNHKFTITPSSNVICKFLV